MNGLAKPKKRKTCDYGLLVVVIILIIVGLYILYSTSAYNGQLKFDDAAYYLKKQLRNYILGIAGMSFFIAIPYKTWKKFGWPAYVVSFLLCVLVIFIGSESHGSARWIYIGPIGFQPSEIAKMGIMIST